MRRTKPRRRKRTRTRLKSGAILWPLMIGNTVAGLLFSPITAATHVRVVGASPSDQPRIEEELQWLKDQPCLLVNNNSVEEQILKRPDVKTATLSRNVFGRGQLQLSYYQPVARVLGTEDTVLTEAGFLCRTADIPDGIPIVQLFDGCAHPSLGMTTSWEPKKVADVCLRAAREGIVSNLSIS